MPNDHLARSLSETVEAVVRNGIGKQLKTEVFGVFLETVDRVHSDPFHLKVTGKLHWKEPESERYQWGHFFAQIRLVGEFDGARILQLSEELISDTIPEAKEDVADNV